MPAELTREPVLLEWAQPLARLAFAVAAEVEECWRFAAAETNSVWPDGKCVESSVGLRDELLQSVPGCEAVYVWGAFRVNPPGVPWHAEQKHVSGGIIYECGHAWVEVCGGVILDITLGQFIGGPALWMVDERVPELWCRYVEEDRPGWA